MVLHGPVSEHTQLTGHKRAQHSQRDKPVFVLRLSRPGATKNCNINSAFRVRMKHVDAAQQNDLE